MYFPIGIILFISCLLNPGRSLYWLGTTKSMKFTDSVMAGQEDTMLLNMLVKWRTILSLTLFIITIKQQQLLTVMILQDRKGL